MKIFKLLAQYIAMLLFILFGASEVFAGNFGVDPDPDLPSGEGEYEHCLLYQGFDSDIGLWKRRTDQNGDYVVNGFINGMDNTPTNNSIGATGMSGDFALEAFDQPGSDVIFNQNYISDINLDGKCMCFDFYIVDRAGAPAVHPQIGFYIGDLDDVSKPYSEPWDGVGTNPNVIDKLVIFRAWNDIPDNTWVRICAPLGTSEEATPPSNADGEWILPSSADLGGAPGMTMADFNNIMSNPSGVMIYIDYIPDPTEKYLIDNICIGDCGNGGDGGAYCGDAENNLLQNGNFEAGDVGFDSEYSSGGVLPGQYVVGNNTDAFGMIVEDHSACADDAYSSNENFLIVNGLTNQPAGSSSIIYSQDVDMQEGKMYKLCINAKNLPNCNFDILPEIQIEVGGEIILPYYQIDADPSDPCNWIEISECFTAGANADSIKIRLKEDGLGDGNDLALDDFYLAEMDEASHDLSVTHNANNTVSATVSPFPLANSDCTDFGIQNMIDGFDLPSLGLPSNLNSDHYWFVFETANPAAITSSMINFAWSDGSGSYGPGASGAAWGLPTSNFGNYNFQNNKFYVVGLYTPGCCSVGIGDGWAYQVIYKSNSGRSINKPTPAISNDVKAEIIKKFVKSKMGDVQSQLKDNLLIYPNPAKGNFTVKMDDINTTRGVVSLYNIKGQLILESSYENELQINVDGQPDGLYILKFKTENNVTITKELVIRK